MQWWNETAPELASTIRWGEPSDVSEAILELSRRRFFRHDLTKALTSSLEREESGLVVLGCSALGHLRSWSALPALITRLDDSDPNVRVAALKALHRITGETFGPDLSLWKALQR